MSNLQTYYNFKLDFQKVNSFGPVMPYGDIDLDQQDGTKPLPEPMLTLHVWGSVAFISEQFHSKCPNMYNELKNNILIQCWINVASPRRQWVKYVQRFVVISFVVIMPTISPGRSVTCALKLPAKRLLVQQFVQARKHQCSVLLTDPCVKEINQWSVESTQEKGQ